MLNVKKIVALPASVDDFIKGIGFRAILVDASEMGSVLTHQANKIHFAFFPVNAV